MHRNAFCGLVLVLTLAAPALAQDGTMVTVYLAPSFQTGERTFIAQPNIPVSVDYDTGWRVGFRLTHSLNDRTSVEGTYALGRNAMNVTQAAPAVSQRHFSFWAQQFAANGLYYFRNAGSEEWKPYATMGLGMARFTPTDEARNLALSDSFLSQPTRIEADNIIAFNFGGGAEKRLGDGPASIRFDLRDYVSDHPTFGLPETPFTPGGAFFPSTGSSHNIEATAGMSFHF